MSESQVTVSAEVFAEKLKKQYPKRASALGDRLIAAFVQDHPRYRVTYDGAKAVSVSWSRNSVSTPVSSPAPRVSSEVPNTNRRKQARVPCRKAKAYVITDDIPGVIVDVVDISRGGLCFVSFERFRPQGLVSIATRYIEGGHNIFQEGRIVRVRHNRPDELADEYAIEFL